MSSKYRDIKRKLSKDLVLRLFTAYRNYHWDRWKVFFEDLGIEGREDFRSFLVWLFSPEDIVEGIVSSSNESVEGSVLVEGDVVEDEGESKYSLNKPYYYDQQRDTYVVHLPNKKKPFAITGAIWRSMVEAYSNWDGAPTTVNEIARKFGLARKTITALFRLMGLTHDSAIWSEEELLKENDEDLVEDLLRRKEERVLVRAQRADWRRVQRDADKYRSYALYAKSIAEHLRQQEGTAKYISKADVYSHQGQYTLLISPTDFHWGKYAPNYTGDRYDRKLAEKRLFDCTKELLSRFDLAPEKIIVAIGGDGLHIDNQNRTTTRGTPQDCDGTPQELASSYVMLCKEYIDYLAQVANVDVYVINGNHDFYTTTLLREALYGWFYYSASVNVVRSLAVRQTFLYGNSLITFMHGDLGSVKDYPAIIAGEDAEKWGKSKYRFIFTGHLHTERELPTFGNVTVYRMPSLAGTDNWHYSKGYKSRKALIGYVVDKRKGVISAEIVPVGEDD